ncbi:MAG: acyltransferase [Sphingopyxis sp.]|nr:acyltransferase [Sphingopyxis sp.]
MRNAGIDRIRIAMTVLVILHHTAITYGGAGGWFWRQEPDSSNLVLVLFNAINQSYFMGFFFLIAGYFTPPARARKGTAQFAFDRGVRLGVPLVLFSLVLHPLTVAIARTSDGEPVLAGWLRAVAERDFAPGPLWFAEALLLFTALYLAGCMAVRHAPYLAAVLAPIRRWPTGYILLLAAVAVGTTSFATRLVFPVGQQFLWLQLGYFPGYVVLFFIGCAAATGQRLETIGSDEAMPWLLATIIGLISLPAVVLLRRGMGAFEGGWNLNALFYAFWEPLVAWGIILGLLWRARTRWKEATPLSSELSASAFGAYILHAPILVALSVAARPWDLLPFAKFLLVGALASIAGFLAAAVLRRVPGVSSIV